MSIEIKKSFLLQVAPCEGEHWEAPSWFLLMLSQDDLDRMLLWRRLAKVTEQELTVEGISSKGEPMKCSSFHRLSVWDFGHHAFFGPAFVNEKDRAKFRELIDRVDGRLAPVLRSPDGIEVDGIVPLTAEETCFIDELIAAETHEDGEFGPEGYQDVEYCLAEPSAETVRWRACMKIGNYEVVTVEMPLAMALDLPQ